MINLSQPTILSPAPLPLSTGSAMARTTVFLILYSKLKVKIK
jgi:hypothetical protein